LRTPNASAKHTCLKGVSSTLMEERGHQLLCG
jgi:hypothetical protein